MKGRRNDVISTLQNPDQVRVSRSDSTVLLFYRKEETSRWVCAVAKRLNGDGFLITTYPTDAIKEGKAGMAQVKVFHDRRGNTLTVWFDDPEQEYSCEETGDEIVLMKNHAGNVIGFEKLNYSASDREPFEVAFSASERE
jgi:hypothetical protein